MLYVTRHCVIHGPSVFSRTVAPNAEPSMLKIFYTTGLIAAALGTLACLFAGLGRLLGHYYIIGFESTTVFQAGIALMVLACMLRLYTPDNKQ